jgi:hypothetical protein
MQNETIAPFTINVASEVLSEASPESVPRAILDGVEKGRRKSSLIPCQRPWRRAGAAVRSKDLNASSRRWDWECRRSHKQRAAFREGPLLE